MTVQTYPGSELELFAGAHNWKAYYAGRIGPYIGGDVLEVGAGIGATAPVLCSAAVRSWTCLEPDPALAERLKAALHARPLPAPTWVQTGSLRDLDPEERFDSILYIDVLEHIADDRGELATAARHLRPSGTLVVLAPAHGFLFSPFDRAIGHHRRYDRRMLEDITSPPLVVREMFYLDAVGMLLSLANRVLLKRPEPRPSQIAFWDRVVIPVTRIVDRVLAHRVGKTVVAVWQHP